MGLRHNRSCKNVLTYHEDRTVGMLQAVFLFQKDLARWDYFKRSESISFGVSAS
jgi:hypothetical protein